MTSSEVCIIAKIVAFFATLEDFFSNTTEFFLGWQLSWLSPILCSLSTLEEVIFEPSKGLEKSLTLVPSLISRSVTMTAKPTPAAFFTFGFFPRRQIF